MSSPRVCIFPVLLILSSQPVVADAQTTLANLYRGGEVRLVPEFTLTDADLPDDNYLVAYEQPWSIAVDDDGNIYFADHGANNIKKFDRSGRFLTVIGREGSGPGDLRTPYYITCSQGRLVVWDMGNTRYCHLTTDGEFISSRPLNRSEEGWPGKLMSLPSGDIVTQSSRTVQEEGGPRRVTDIRLYSPDMEYRRTIYRNSDNSRKTLPDNGANIPVPFSPSVYWSVTPDGRIVIGYSDEYRIEIHDPENGLISSFEHDYTPVRTTQEDQETWFGSITTSNSEGNITFGAPDWIVDNTEFPRFKPAFGQIIIDSEGNILVQTYRRDADRDFRSFDAFSSAGSFLGTVEITEGGAYPLLGAPIFQDYLIIGEQGEFGAISLIKYRIAR